MSAPIVIVGGGLAAAKAAERLRTDGFDGDVVVLAEEPVRPYERPPLSKSFLWGESAAEDAFVHGPTFYEDHGIDLRLGSRVEDWDLAGRRLRLAGGATLEHGPLLLATGAAPRRLPVHGGDLPGVLQLRTMEDAEVLRRTLDSAATVVVVGGGWIGCEVAASARRHDVEVTLVEAAGLPLQRVLGEDLGRFYRDLHSAHGVEFRLGRGVEELRGGDAVEEVVLSDGERVRADAVVVGVGVSPRVELAAGAGLEVANGVVADAHLATSAPDVYAAGDVANAWHPVLGRRVRLEHWSSALNQGPVAAANMLGAGEEYRRIPYFFSDQYEVGMEYSGLADPATDTLVLRGEPSSAGFIAFWLRDGRVTAGMNVNVWDAADRIAGLVAGGKEVDVAGLADPDVDLAELTSSPA